VGPRSPLGAPRRPRHSRSGPRGPARARATPAPSTMSTAGSLDVQRTSGGAGRSHSSRMSS
jgi:hypothetical protein